MSLLQAMEKEVKRIAKEALDEKIASWRVAERPSQFSHRGGAEWEKDEESHLTQEVLIFLDTLALAHKRTRSGIISRLNKLMQEGKLCGLRDDERISMIRSR